jgi:hypothetical protein
MLQCPYKLRTQDEIAFATSSGGQISSAPPCKTVYLFCHYLDFMLSFSETGHSGWFG